MVKGAPKRQREPQADVAGNRIAAMSALGVFGFATTMRRPQPAQSGRPGLRSHSLDTH